jgi:hypothetical protein
VGERPPVGVQVERRVGRDGSLDGRHRATACVPERKHFDCFRRDAVVEMIVDAAEVNTPDTRESCVARKRANARLAPNQCKGPLDLVSNGSRSCNSIDFPPIRGFVDFGGSATATRISSN